MVQFKQEKFPPLIKKKKSKEERKEDRKTKRQKFSALKQLSPMLISK